MSVYQPWYVKRQCPIWFDCCLPAYRSVFNVRLFILMLGTSFICTGLFLLIVLFFLAILSSVAASYASLLITLSLFLLIFGIIIFHLGWAAYLLEWEAVSKEETTAVVRVSREAASPTQESPFQETTDRAHQPPPPSKGYWMFAEEPAWQAVSSRDTLQ